MTARYHCTICGYNCESPVAMGLHQQIEHKRRPMDACDENPAGIAHCWHTGNDPKKGLYKFCCWCGQRAYVNPQDPPGHGKFLEENTK